MSGDISVLDRVARNLPSAGLNMAGNLKLVKQHYQTAKARSLPIVGGESYVEDVGYLLDQINRYEQLLSKMSKWNDGIRELKVDYGIYCEEDEDIHPEDSEDM